MTAKFLRSVAVLVLVAGLAACESSEKRAEGHYQSGLELLEQGEIDKAMVEFRNALKYNEAHVEARESYAKALRENGQGREAYAQYLAVAERAPRDLEARIALTQMAMNDQAWNEAERHGKVAIELAPDNVDVKVIAAALALREGLRAKDNAARDQAAADALALLDERPDDPILIRIALDNLLRDQKFDEALVMVDRALAANEGDRGLFTVKLGILSQLGRDGEVETLLLDMINRFPEDELLRSNLMRYYASKQDAGKAEAFLRSRADAAAEPPLDYLALVQFLSIVKGPEAALAEVESVIAEGKGGATVRGVRAGLLYQTGRKDEAVSILQSLTGSEEPGVETDRLKIALAKMLVDQDNKVGARRLVEEVIARDPGQVDALKMSAAWLIQSDDVDKAVEQLRTALDQNPNDAGAMTLMAAAYQRSGATELANDFLSMAVEASNHGPDETIRYAKVLVAAKSYQPAEDILIQALKQAPAHIALLNEIGRLYIAQEDWPRVQQVIDQLKRLNTAQATSTATQLNAVRIARQNNTEEALAYVEGLAESADSDLAARISVVRARLAASDAPGALDYAREVAAANPDNIAASYALAAALVANGEVDEAAQTYDEILGQNPGAIAVWMQYIRLKSSNGDNAGAEALLKTALEQNPDAPDLLWAQATRMEQTGDIDGAIAIYERLYEVNSNAVVVANNLASLLATYRDDKESRDRAWVVGRRLRGTDVPAFQDTYGWILYLRGNAEEAVEYLEPAAAKLTDDPIVHYHLGAAYEKLGRAEDAVAEYQKAVDIAGEGDTRPQIAAAREGLERKGVSPAQ